MLYLLLVLSENLLYGQIPSELSSMPSLQLFAAFREKKSGPRLSGSLPSLHQLPQLTGLYLQGNEIEGPIPDNFISASQSVEVVKLSGNMLTGIIPGSLGQIPELTLELADNQISGFPVSFCTNKGWMEGAISRYGCDGFLCPPGTASTLGWTANASTTCTACPSATNGSPTYYGATSCNSPLTQREILVNLYYALDGPNWYHNDFWCTTADVCDWYGIGCRNGHVVLINLRGNNLRGLPGPDLFYLSELQTLWLYSNPLAFSFENIESAKKLQDLRLDATLLHSLHGVGDATSLVSLDASFTALRGSFPEEEILRLTNLRSLKLNDNSFSGTLPKSFASLTYLVNLRLDSNAFTGSLPGFDDMHLLNYIDISDNTLTGPISRKFLERIGADSNPTIRLAGNQLTGVVPQEFDRFKELTVHLAGNQILGLPVVLCDNANWNNGDVGLYGCDGILCKPGTVSTHGRTSAYSSCGSCASATYYGEITCPGGIASASTSALVSGAMTLALLMAVAIFIQVIY